MFIFFLFFFTGVSASSSALLSAHKSCASEKDLNKLNGILSLSLAQVSVIYIYVFVLSSTIFQQIDYYRKLNIGLAALFYLTTSHTLCFLPDWFFLVVFLHPHFFHFNFLLLRFVHAIASQPAMATCKIITCVSTCIFTFLRLGMIFFFLCFAQLPLLLSCCSMNAHNS